MYLRNLFSHLRNTMNPTPDQTNAPATPTAATEAPPTAMPPEEQEAAAAANQADQLQALSAELAAAKAQNADLADQFLRAKAEADNARRRAEEDADRRDPDDRGIRGVRQASAQHRPDHGRRVHRIARQAVGRGRS
jgi:hypothetical protein